MKKIRIILILIVLLSVGDWLLGQPIGGSFLAVLVHLTDNDSTNENNVIVFVADADSDGGPVRVESDSDLYYNPSTGTLTANAFAGDVTGTVTGNASTATALQTPRDIGGVSFDGTASITPTTIVVADTEDATTFVGLWTDATGSLLPKTDEQLTYVANTGTLTATEFVGGGGGLTGVGDMTKAVYDVLDNGLVDGADTALALNWDTNPDATSKNTLFDALELLTFNVQTYGADPTGVADSGAAFTAAFAAAETAGGGIVLLPYGRYLIVTQLLFPEDTPIILKGVGWSDAGGAITGSVILSTLRDGTSAAIDMNTNNSGTSAIRDLALIGGTIAEINGGQNVSYGDNIGNSVGILMDSHRGAEVSNVLVRGFDDIGVDMSSQGGVATMVYAHLNGIGFDHSTGGGGGSFYECVARSNTHGIKNVKRFIGGVIESNFQNGAIYTEGEKLLDGVHFENNCRANINPATDPADVAGLASIQLSGTAALTIRNCPFRTDMTGYSTATNEVIHATSTVQVVFGGGSIFSGATSATDAKKPFYFEAVSSIHDFGFPNLWDYGNANGGSFFAPAGTTYIPHSINGMVSMTTGDATPSVQAVTQMRSVGTTAITNFDFGYDGQEFTFFADTSIPITHNANIKLKQGVNWAMVAGDTLRLMNVSGVWYDSGSTFDAGAGGGNAWSDAVDSDILPTGNDDTFDLGSAAASFAELWWDGAGSGGTLGLSGLLTANAGVEVKNGATAAGFVTIFEDSDDGGNFTKIQVVAQAGNITLSLPPDDGDAGEQLQTDGAGVLTWEASGTTLYNDIGDPDAAGSISFADTETATHITATTATDFFHINATGIFGDISILKVTQDTGNPTDGALAEFSTADGEDDVDQLLLGNGTDDQMTIRVIEAGTVTFDAISDGTPLFVFSDKMQITSSVASETLRLGGVQNPGLIIDGTNGAGSDWGIVTNRAALGDFGIGVAADGSAPATIMGNPVLYITSAGDVKIGGIDPADKLDVTGGGVQIQEQADGFAIIDTTQIGIVKFFGDDDTASADEIAGQIEVISTGVWTNGAEDAKMVLNAANNGTLNANQLVLNTDGSISLAGDLTISGDDLFMNTNTDTAQLVADGTNYNPVVPTGDVLMDNAGAVVIQTDAVDDTMIDFGAGAGQVNAGDIPIALGGGSPTVDQIQEYFDNTGSSGFFLGGAISDGGAGTVDVAAGEGFIRTTNDDNAELQSFKWSASNGIAVTDDTTQYIYVDDAGAISLSTSEFLERPDLIKIGVVTDEAGVTIHTFNLGVRLQESVAEAGRFIRRVHGISRDKRKGGLIMGQSGDANRDVTFSSGSLWWGRTEYIITSFNTSGADTFPTYSANGQEAASASQWPNAQYDNAGTLTTMTNNKWANLFFWAEPDDNWVMVYGRAEFNSEALADEEHVPSTSLPSRVTETGILVSRLTFQKSANTGTISSAFEDLFANASTSDHTTLSNLAWTTALHTGTASTLAGFDGGGAASEYTESNYTLVDSSRAFTGGVDLGTSQALVGTTAMTIGDGTQTVAINSSDWDIDATGIVTNTAYDSDNNTLTNVVEDDCKDGSDLVRSAIEFVVDGGGSVITTGIKGDLEVPFNCTIQRVTMLADQSGSIVIDIWVDSYANFPPTVADTITASAIPTISTAVKSQDATLTGWTVALTAGDVIRWNVNSVTTIERCTISLVVEK